MKTLKHPYGVQVFGGFGGFNKLAQNQPCFASMTHGKAIKLLNFSTRNVSKSNREQQLKYHRKTTSPKTPKNPLEA